MADPINQKSCDDKIPILPVHPSKCNFLLTSRAEYIMQEILSTYTMQRIDLVDTETSSTLYSKYMEDVSRLSISAYEGHLKALNCNMLEKRISTELINAILDNYPHFLQITKKQQHVQEVAYLKAYEERRLYKEAHPDL